MAGKLLTFPGPTRPLRAGRARLLRVCQESRLTQAELGALIGTDDRGVRRLQRANRKRADRLDLVEAIDAYMARKKAA